MSRMILLLFLKLDLYIVLECVNMWKRRKGGRRERRAKEGSMRFSELDL